MNFATEVIKIGQPSEPGFTAPDIFETKPGEELKYTETKEPEEVIKQYDEPSQEAINELFDSKEFKKFSEAEKRKGFNILKQAGAKLNEFPFLNTPAKKAIIAIIAVFLSLGAVATAVTFTVEYINDIVKQSEKKE